MRWLICSCSDPSVNLELKSSLLLSTLQLNKNKKKSYWDQNRLMYVQPFASSEPVEIKAAWMFWVLEVVEVCSVIIHLELGGLTDFVTPRLFNTS